MPHPPQRTRGNYAKRVCDPCRQRKVKCDEERPSCGTCRGSSRIEQCHYSKKESRRPQNRGIESLLGRIAQLEDILHSAGLSYKLEEEHQSCPDMVSGADDSESSDGESIGDIADLAAPMRNLQLQHDDLVLHNAVSVYRYQPPSVAPLPSSRIPRDTSRSYILQLSSRERDKDRFNFELEFDRYLPHDLPGGLRLTREEHDRCLDVAFKFVLSWGQQIIQPLFFRDMYSVLNSTRSSLDEPPQASHFSPMLHNALVALALSFAEDPAYRRREIKDCFANNAKSFIDQEVEKPALSAVHGLGILSTYYCSIGDQSRGFLYAGISGRICQACLHVDSSQWVQEDLISAEYLKDRNWAWWTHTCLEISWSALVGRDVCIPYPQETQSMSQGPFVESQFDKIPFNYPQLNVPPQANDISLTFYYTCTLYAIIKTILEMTGGLSATRVKQFNCYDIHKLETKLQDWEESLPPALQMAEEMVAVPHKMMLHCARWWASILLHRPFFHRRERSIKEHNHWQVFTRICQTAAQRIMHFSKIMQGVYTLRNVPIAFLQFVFAAGTVFLLLAAQSSTNPHPNAARRSGEYLHLAEDCIKFLTESSQTLDCANDIAKILKEKVEQVKEYLTSKGSGVMDESTELAVAHNLTVPEANTYPHHPVAHLPWDVPGAETDMRDYQWPQTQVDVHEPSNQWNYCSPSSPFFFDSGPGQPEGRPIMPYPSIPLVAGEGTESSLPMSWEPWISPDTGMTRSEPAHVYFSY